MHRLIAWALTATVLGIGFAEPAPADDLLTDALKKAQVEAQVAREALKAKTADVERLQKELAALREEITRLRVQNLELAKRIAEFRHGGGAEPAKLEAPPMVDGLVLAVSAQGLVEISLGSDDGIQVGHELEVFRMNQDQAAYLGRIVIRRTRPERAVGEKLRNFPAQVNDRVMTKMEK